MAIKNCSRCRQALPIDSFRPLPKRGGHMAYCRPCEVEYKREHYQKNRARIHAKSKQWRADNPERYKESNRRYYEANKELLLAKSRELQRAPHRVAYRTEWRRRNIEKQRQVEARYREQNREACNARCKQWKQVNPQRLTAYWATRRSMQRRIPAWADTRVMAAIYAAAREGEHVDHIVPLVSDLVCGLHCEANLQIISAEENIRKGNRWWPDMPEPVNQNG